MSERSSQLVVGCVQMHSVLDSQVNLVRCLEIADEARRRGVQLLIFPESTTSRSDDPSVSPHAEAVDGDFMTSFRDQLADVDMTVIIGMTEQRENDRPYNTLVAFRRGKIVEKYRKFHLYDAAGSRESDDISPGDGPVHVFDVGGFRVGMMTCYDIRFPELARLLAERGADLLAVPTSWVSGPLKEEHWKILCAARAIENTVYVVGAGQTGGNRIGRSAVVSPEGIAQASAGLEQTLLVSTVSATRLQEVRSRFPMLAQKRFTIDSEARPARTIHEV